MYPQGYFHQHLSAEGWQEESYERLNWNDAPIDAATTPDGKPCIIAVPLGDRSVLATVWRVRLGRVTLYLLDTDLEENAPWDRELSARLYGGDRETRIQQEIVLGIGGVRALKALGIEPAALSSQRRPRRRSSCCSASTISSSTARTSTRPSRKSGESTIFTTHTPVPAGHDAFPFHLVEKHLAGCWGTLGANRDRFLALGAHDSGAGDAVQHDGARDAFGRQHQRRQPAARRGHARHVGRHLARRRRRTTGPSRTSPTACTCRRGLPASSPSSSRSTSAPAGSSARTIRRCGTPCSASPTRISGPCASRCGAICSPSSASARASDGPTNTSARRASSPPARCSIRTSLTIGFARRFAGYKRPELVFTDPERLARILNAAGRPVQIVFAGKAHPADDIGKHHLQRVYRRALDPRLAAASRSSTTTTCTSRTFSCRDATCG